eukprot:gene19781-biopygen7007
MRCDAIRSGPPWWSNCGSQPVAAANSPGDQHLLKHRFSEQLLRAERQSLIGTANLWPLSHSTVPDHVQKVR